MKAGPAAISCIWRPAAWPPSVWPALVWPLIDQMNPSADVLALSSTEVDIAKVEVGQRIKVLWRGHPVFVAHRTPEEIKEAEDVNVAELRDPQTDAQRVQKPEWLIVVGVCTHLGCIPLGTAPTDPRGEFGGWFCPCHGSQYDTSGRIRLGPGARSISRCRPTSSSAPPRFASVRTALMTASATRTRLQEPDHPLDRPPAADLQLSSIMS